MRLAFGIAPLLALADVNFAIARGLPSCAELAGHGRLVSCRDNMSGTPVDPARLPNETITVTQTGCESISIETVSIDTNGTRHDTAEWPIRRFLTFTQPNQEDPLNPGVRFDYVDGQRSDWIDSGDGVARRGAYFSLRHGSNESAPLTHTFVETIRRSASEIIWSKEWPEMPRDFWPFHSTCSYAVELEGK